MELASKRLGDGVRLTSLTEEIDFAVRSPIARAMSVDFHGRFQG
jgi:hypothetical protein